MALDDLKEGIYNSGKKPREINLVKNTKEITCSILDFKSRFNKSDIINLNKRLDDFINNIKEGKTPEVAYFGENIKNFLNPDYFKFKENDPFHFYIVDYMTMYLIDNFLKINDISIQYKYSRIINSYLDYIPENKLSEYKSKLELFNHKYKEYIKENGIEVKYSPYFYII